MGGLGHLGNVHALAAAICQLGGADPVLCGISALDGETGALAHDMRETADPVGGPARSTEPHSLTVARHRAADLSGS
jgi:hypothetical protein